MDDNPFFRMVDIGTNSHPFDYGLKDLIQLISNVTESFTAALFLFDISRKYLNLEWYHSLSLHIDPETKLQAGDSLIGWVAKTQRPVYIPQFDRDTRNLKMYLRDEKIKSFLAVPVGEVGVLCVDSKRNYVFSEKEQKLLQDFAALILHLLQVRTMAEQENRQRSILEFFDQINDLSQTKQDLSPYCVAALRYCRLFSRTDTAFLVMVLGKKDQYKVTVSEGKIRAPLKKTILSIDMGLTGWVIREQKPLVLRSMKPKTHKSYVFFPDDPCTHFQSYIGLPLCFFGRLFGVINLIGQRENDWKDEEIQALTSAGQIIITSILYLMNL
jgi:signal transduction protein with GAF and PtsI domain